MAAALLVYRRKPKEYRHTGHVQQLNDEEMRERYRFTNHGIQYIVNLLENDLVKDTKRSFALSPRQQVLIALRFFASGSMYQVIGDTMGYDKGTVSRTVDRVTAALLDHIHEFVRWPDATEAQKIMSNFYKKAGFPNVIGCIDGTHVRIQAPSVDEASYVNRKGFHSINVQAVCDDQGKFTSINASWPGSCHDSHIFRTSGLCAKLEQHRSFVDGILLGDSGYACRPFLMTPFLVTETDDKVRYQTSHIKTRVTIERAFGQLKRRFHVLHSEIRLSPIKVCRITSACTILHNIAIMLKEPEVGDDVEDTDLLVDHHVHDGNQGDGSNTRHFIVENYFS